MKFMVTILLLLVIISGCQRKESNATDCNPDNPLEMQWMADWVGELQHCVCTISIFQAEYNGETVFWPLTNDPLCQSVIEHVPVYNCLGDEILVLKNYEDWSTFNEQVTNQKIIYACPKN